MNFPAQMRVGTLEITAALFAVAAVASRPRLFGEREIGVPTPMRISIAILERGNERQYDGLCPLVIGRSADVGLPLNDAEASRRHARVECANGVAYLRDLESSNGTFLNGRRVGGRAIEIRSGDEIDIGGTRLRVEKVVPWT